MLFINNTEARTAIIDQRRRDDGMRVTTETAEPQPRALGRPSRMRSVVRHARRPVPAT